MKNNKGFTLIEMIIVVAILAILVIILIPNILGLINKNKEQSCNNIVESIEKAASIYVSDNKYELGINCTNNTKEIELKTLIDNKLVSSPIINPMTDEDISDDPNIYVLVTYDCINKTFAYQVNGIFCS